jgi:hypothetical protein
MSLRLARTLLAFPGAGGKQRSGPSWLLLPLDCFYSIDMPDDSCEGTAVDPKALSDLSHVFQERLGARPKAQLQARPVRDGNAQMFPKMCFRHAFNILVGCQNSG